MNYQEAHKKIRAARALILEEGSSTQTLKSLFVLLHGAHPDIDTVLVRAGKALETFEKAYGGQIVELTAENLPENTEEQKKRKRALLLLIVSWDNLKSEVARVDKLLTEANQAHSSTEKISRWGRVFSFAKGPLGIFTVVAVALVLVMQKTSVKLTIKNEGCSPILAASAIPVSLPGFSLPKDPIPSGGFGVAVLPPLTVRVDNTVRGEIALGTLAFSKKFPLSSDLTEVTIDGVSLLGKNQSIKLSEKKQHALIVVCR